jgi:hemolysin III
LDCWLIQVFTFGYVVFKGGWAIRESAKTLHRTFKYSEYYQQSLKSFFAVSDPDSFLMQEDHSEFLGLMYNETANSATHALGLLFSVILTIKLIKKAHQSGDRRALIGNWIFGCSLIILYAMSTLYHGISDPAIKHILRYGDHIAIFLLIAGTYTPITMGPLWGTSGRSILIIIWSMAFIGILAKLFFFAWFMKISLSYFIGMGWVIMISMKDVIRSLSKQAIWCLVAGGLAYTSGCHFFKKDREGPLYHAVWHLFVLMGSAAHGIAVLKFM